MPRTIVIGDIHGAVRALEQLIKRIKPKKNDCFVFLGDYVDGWSQSAEVIQYLINFSEQHDCVFIKGNHDAWCEAWLAGFFPGETWLFHGGVATIQSYEHTSEDEKQNHLAFFNKMHNYYIDEANRLFIHAGFSSMHGPAHETYETNYSWDRTLWEMAIAVNKKIRKNSVLYPKRLSLFEEIYIGHTPTINYDVDVPMQAMNVWNVDTGAAFYGKLSALDIKSKKIWQSDIVQDLYPNEKGRN